MPDGQYPRVVWWDQGSFDVRLDLLTGQRTYGISRSRATPEESFRVLTTSKTPPKLRRFNMGVVDALVEAGGLRFQFQRNRLAAQRLGGRLRRSGMRR